jgi:hypothetical protein
MKNQTTTPVAALRARTAVSFLLPADVSSPLPAWLQIDTANAGHVSAGIVGVGTHAGMSANLVSVVKTDPDFRPTPSGTAKQARPPRGIPS